MYARLAAIFWLLCLLALLFPVDFWGVHQLAFLPLPAAVALLLVSGAAIALALFPNRFRTVSVPPAVHTWLVRGSIVVLPALFYLAPIVADNYGDAVAYQTTVHETATSLPADAWQQVFSLSLNPDAGRKGLEQLITIASYHAGASFYAVFRWMDLLCGLVFVLALWWMIRLNIRQPRWQWMLALAGLSAPFMLVFYGHIETYAPVMACTMLLLTVISKHEHCGHWGWLVLAALLALLCIRLHTLTVLLLPLLVLAGLRRYWPSGWFTTALHRPRGLALWLWLPALLGGLVLYFFVFQDYNDPRILKGIEPSDRMFLPLLSPAPPLDTYNLFSWNHITDFANVVWYWGPGALLLLLLAVFMRKSIDWTQPAALYPLAALGLFTGLLFAINPLLTMPMDWDLFCLPAPVLLALAIGLARQFEAAELHFPVVWPAVAITLLCVPIFWVNAQPEAHSQRLETVGIRIHQTYYERAGGYLEYALRQSATQEQYFERQAQVLEQLHPDWVTEPELAYARDLTDTGLLLLQRKDTASGLNRMFQSHYHAPWLGHNLVYLTQTLYLYRRSSEALHYAHMLVELGYPNTPRATRIAMVCALEAEEYVLALEWADAYNELVPDAASTREVASRLRNNDRVGELKHLFKRK